MTETLLKILFALLEEFGPHIVRRQIDEWEAAKAASDAAFRAKFGQSP